MLLHNSQQSCATENQFKTASSGFAALLDISSSPEPDEGFDQSLNLTQLQPSDNLDFMSADQTFHTPSFGDEEFEVPTLNYNNTNNIRYGVSGQGSFTNQILPYQRSSPVSHQPQQHMPCQQQQHQQQNHHIYGPPQSPQAMIMNNGQYHHNSPSPQQTRSSPPQNIYQNEMMSPHSMNMQMQQQFDGCSPYQNAQMHQAPMQQPPPMHMMHQQHPQQMGVHMGPPQQQQPMFSTISQTQLSNQLGLQIGMGAPGVPHHHLQGPPPSGTPPGSNHNSPCRETSEDSDDSAPLTQLMGGGGGVKRPSPEPVENIPPKVVKKPKVPKKKKKRDPNEPQKPVSAYALFFRDTQAAIKGQSPNASFGEVSKIVASMWDGLEPEAKNIYKKKTETAKKEYLKALAAYRATLVSKAAVDQSDSMYNPNPVNSTSPPITSSPVTSPNGVILSPLQKRSPVLTSVMDSMQPVTSMPGHPQLVATTQQGWHVQSQPQMMNGNSSPQLAVVSQMNSGNMVNMQQQMQQAQSPPQQMTMNRPMQQQQQQQMPTVPQNICHSSSNSPSYPHNVSPPSVNGGHSNVNSNDMMTPVQTCLRNGCSNLAVDSPDWDREYCSNECVVSHCRDVFTAWVASRQVNTAYSTVK